MIFKVFYQESATEPPVREKTKTLYVKAQNEVEVRQALKEEDFRIEHIEPLSKEHLEYEKKQPSFALYEK